jgi:hypothetical protein
MWLWVRDLNPDYKGQNLASCQLDEPRMEDRWHYSFNIAT